MSKKQVTGILFLLGALICALWNIFSGWQLSQNSISSAEMHLIRGVLTTTFCILGNILCISESSTQSMLIRIKLSALDDSTLEFKKFSESKKQAQFWAWLSIGLVIPSLITGTSSQAGSIPFVHAILGVSVVISYLGALLSWWRHFQLCRRF